MTAELNVTCHAAPTQIEGVTADGERVYFRYRWGQATLHLDGQLAWAERYGHSMDSTMDSATATRLVNALVEARAAHLAALQQLPLGPVPPLSPEAEAAMGRMTGTEPPQEEWVITSPPDPA